MLITAIFCNCLCSVRGYLGFSLRQAKIRLLICIVVVILANFTKANNDVTVHVQALNNRVLTRGGINFSFTPVLEMIHTVVNELGQGVDQFVISENRQTKQVIPKGSSCPALSAAFGKYMRYYMNCDIH